ncbi:hypothetical protein VTK56DRAFT_5126 [Thermocarpiscus australiensis]
MIVKDLKRLALLAGPLLALLLLSASLWHRHTDFLRSNVSALLGKQKPADSNSDPNRNPALPLNETHNEIFSVSTPKKKHFEIRFGKHVFNPNMIPHPSRDDTWIIAGQLRNDPDDKAKLGVAEEVGCNAQFIGGVLMCVDDLRVLPIAPTTGDKCEGDIAYFNLNVGPHDARVFYGPQKPYTIYGSNSGFTCFGMWIQDFRKLVDWGFELFTDADFSVGTELQRPPPYGVIEKNWFVFWDKDDQMHAHYDMFPKRTFAKLESNGSAGPDLAPDVAAQDEQCMARYLPELPPTLESIHQATNSLRVTLCNRADSQCTPDDSNTFILTIIQHKTFYDWHGEYEPYVVLFYQRAPYELYAISKKPLWIHGRQRTGDRHSEMFYVTSMSWKMRGMKYHGFLDDVLFLAFGIEDKDAGGMDVRAGDLLVDLGLCTEA